ncbi:MAG: UDP-N-acetylmuramate dehydrogenase [Kosmotogales bacterium]|nr:UDP-N-acetylmuramate dehydrogenase [Kosmotogales bacterium]
MKKIFNKLYLLGCEVKKNYPLKFLTSIKIGGEAKYLVKPYDCESYIQLLKFLFNNDIKFKIVGNMSNIIPGEFYDGIIVSTNYLNFFGIQEEFVYVEPGMQVNSLIRILLNNGYGGLEFLSGLPGTVGGAVFMNAGAFDGEIKDVVESVFLVDKSGNEKIFSREDMNFSYRNSILREKDFFVKGVKIKIRRTKPESLSKRMNEILCRRLEKQPLLENNSGSVFIRPFKTFYVGSTIDRYKLKGLTVGDAQVSSKHAGFIINKKNATQRDVKILIRKIQDIIFENERVLVKREIEFI